MVEEMLWRRRYGRTLLTDLQVRRMVIVAARLVRGMCVASRTRMFRPFSALHHRHEGWKWSRR